MGPAYHPEWLVTFWLTTPGLNWLNPHYLLMIAGVGLVITYLVKRKKTEAVDMADPEDERFKHLLLRKKVIEEQMENLEGKRRAAEISEADFAGKITDYENHLKQVKNELHQYTL